MNKLTMKMRLFAAFLLLGLWGATAQTAREQIAAMPERAGGIYHSYEYLPGPAVPAPKGYVPFYISHYGRHGSRWHTSEKIYAEPLGILRKADSAGVLTPKGRDLLAKVEVIAADARDRYGDLSPRGVAEHRGIAERMYKAYPEVFSTGDGRECYVQSRSTLVPRCILSMAAFNERLKELDPRIRMVRTASARDLSYLANGERDKDMDKAAREVADSAKRAWLHPERLLSALFTDEAPQVADPQRFMWDLFMLTSIAQDIDRPEWAFYDIFTPGELYALWESLNAYCYLTMGPSLRFGDPVVASARPLLRDFVETARRVIDGKEPLAASLRFGHDVYLTPLAALLQVEGASARVASVDEVRSCWSIEKVSPMAGNVQFVFFRNAAGDVRVRVLYNERDARLPLDGGPYYEWEALKRYCERLYE